MSVPQPPAKGEVTAVAQKPSILRCRTSPAVAAVGLRSCSPTAKDAQYVSEPCGYTAAIMGNTPPGMTCFSHIYPLLIPREVDRHCCFCASSISGRPVDRVFGQSTCVRFLPAAEAQQPWRSRPAPAQRTACIESQQGGIGFCPWATSLPAGLPSVAVSATTSRISSAI